MKVYTVVSMLALVVHTAAVGGIHPSESDKWAGLSADGDDVDSPLIPSAEEVAAAQEAWSRRVLGADKNERDAQLHQRLQAAKRPASSRRNLQSGGEGVWSDMWNFDSSVLTGSMAGSTGGPNLPGEDERWLALPSGSDGDAAAQAMLSAARVGGQGVCEDPRAENFGALGTCGYDCATLEQHFFPESQDTHCFLYNGGWPVDLMGMRRDRLDWHTCKPYSLDM